MKMLELILEETKEEQVLGHLKQLIHGTEWEGRIFLVGGAVRDEIMGTKPKDLDFVVNGDNLKAGIQFSVWLAKKYDIYRPVTNPVIFERFGTAKIDLKYNNANLPEIELEFVAPRREKYYESSRKPDVTGGDLHDEATRRDLTINSLMKNISTGKILDLTGKGIDDIKNGILRTPADPEVTFFDDPLRMMRIIRFSVKYGFKIMPETLASMKEHSYRICVISAERVHDELNKILISPDPAKGIRLLQETGLMDEIMEEFTDAVGMTQNKYHDHDVFNHTLDVVSKTPADLKTRLIALFHDIGKTVTKTVTPEGDVHFYGHEKEGAEIARKIMNRLRYPGELIDAVVKGVKHHMSLKHGGDDAVVLTDKTLRKFKVALGDHLEHILDVIHADNISHSEAGAMPNQITQVRKRLEKLNANMERNQPALPINGFDVMNMGVKPGPKVREILNAVTEAWYDNPDITREEAIEIVKGFLED